jgi:hypothetical protein
MSDSTDEGKGDHHIRLVAKGKRTEYVRFVHFSREGPVSGVDFTWEEGHAYRFRSYEAASTVAQWIQTLEAMRDTEIIIDKAEPFDWGPDGPPENQKA